MSPVISWRAASLRTCATQSSDDRLRSEGSPSDGRDGQEKECDETTEHQRRDRRATEIRDHRKRSDAEEDRSAVIHASHE